MSKRNEQKREERSAYLFLAPYLILFLAFIVIPVDRKSTRHSSH